MQNDSSRSGFYKLSFLKTYPKNKQFLSDQLNYFVLLISLITIIQLNSCKGSAVEESSESEVAQQLGDVVASVDEVGGSAGLISLNIQNSYFRTLVRLDQSSRLESLLDLSKMNPNINAYADSCSSINTYSSCIANTITRNFGSCTMGSKTFAGSVNLVWGGSSSSCNLVVAGDSISRSPAFTITGRRDATLTVSKTGSFGQKLTWISGTGFNKVFSLTNDGIRRTFVNSENVTTFDFTTMTNSAVTVTGSRRNERVMSGGSFVVTNHLTNVLCTYVPSQLTWTSSCNCPTSGSWAASCTDGNTATLTHDGCGIANFEFAGASESIELDRCYGI